MKKSDKNFFNKNKSYQVLKDLLRTRLDDKIIEAIWQTAGDNLESLRNKYKDAPQGEQFHLNGTILPRIAMYQAMTENMAEEEAVSFIDQTVERSCMKIGKLLDKITSLPGMANVFLYLFRKMTLKIFGENNGFKQVVYEEGKETLRFDITECPYHKYSRENQSTKIAHTFCDSDLYCYGHLTKIKFERTETIGRGGTRCDFRLSLRKK